MRSDAVSENRLFSIIDVGGGRETGLPLEVALYAEVYNTRTLSEYTKDKANTHVIQQTLYTRIHV